MAIVAVWRRIVSPLFLSEPISSLPGLLLFVYFFTIF